jgi:hypothetical protein
LLRQISRLLRVRACRLSHYSQYAWTSSAIALLAAVGLGGCDPTANVAVNPDFEMTPPIARDVEVRQLKPGPNGQLLVVADFGRGTLRDKYHAVQLSEGKVVLRDDGRGGDEQSGDGKFSVRMQENVDSVSQALQEQSRFAEQVTFQGRERLGPEKSPQMRLDLESFRKGGSVHIPNGDILCMLFTNVSIEHSLMVTNLAVVEDPTRTNRPCDTAPLAGGAWSFGRLMADMANTPATGVSAEDFVKSWLGTWLGDVTVNSEIVAARQSLFNQVISPWVARSGSPVGTFDRNTWQQKPLDLKFAPFKLIAIVNRLDLRGNSAYGFSNPGEGRFVFEALTANCSPLRFTVIFEYGLPISSCQALKDYAGKWYDLKQETLGSAAYNQNLQALTDAFAAAGAAPQKPNGSALNQIRTNEIALASPWELREFNIDPNTHLLFETTVKQEPAKKYNAKAQPPGSTADVSLMAKWVNDNDTRIIADRHTVPAALSTGEAFLGGKSHTESSGFWDAAPMQITQDDARHHFSLNTCSGCHGGETQTPFVHVGTVPVPFGTEAALSGFLRTITVTDPAGRPTGNPATRTFSDLERRQQSLTRLLCTQCRSKFIDLLTALQFKPVHMTH